MRSSVDGRTLAVLLALGGCAQHHRASEETPRAEGTLDARNRAEDAADVDADRAPSAPPDESVTSAPRSPAARRQVARVPEALRAEPREPHAPVVPQRDAVAGTDRDPTAVEIAAEQDHAVVERCARMRSLPTWCVERERARVRKRGTP